MSITLQPLSHIHSHCKAYAVIAMSGVSRLDSFEVMLHHRMLGDLPVPLAKACAIFTLAQKELRLRTFVLGDHPSPDILSSLDSMFGVMLCHHMLGDLPVTIAKACAVFALAQREWHLGTFFCRYLLCSK
eukprot:scaffold38937_cov44-Attheya_sp.AAC.1